ncbi:MAG: aryl-sulfate sulfotransferase [Proteobacteria bacterium]|nr:aryl-sulfate sulfotransferase [Pseudomonadota bacterium]
MPPPILKYGLYSYDKDRATSGFTLFSPLGLEKTHVINMNGDVVHEWDLPGEPGNYTHLLPNGNLLAAIRVKEGPQNLPAKGGHIIEMDWEGNTVWEHIDPVQHHDFRRLENGNTIYLGWKLLNEEQMKRHTGGLPGTEHADGVYGDTIVEINPDGEVVWDWFVGDHMEMEKYPNHPGSWRREYAHGNTVAPTLNGDIIINQRMNGTMAIIDKQTKKIKWAMQDFHFGQQHDVQMLPNGNLLFFANGAMLATYHGPETGSRVIELNPETNEIVWEYHGNAPRDFFSWFISGCQRLESGNTLICEGIYGHLFEVTPERDVVWDYVSPYIVEYDHPAYKGANPIFRAYRYAADSPEIRGRLGDAG